MSFLLTERQFDPDVPELMDTPGSDEKLLEEDLRNLRIMNRYFGGLRAARKHILPLLMRHPHGRELTILDLACGSCDHAVSLVQLAKSIGRQVRVKALDINPKMVEVSRRLTAGIPEIEVLQGNILQSRGKEWHADIILCSLAIHHFSETDAVQILRTMNEQSRLGFLVNEIKRNQGAAWCAWLYTHLTTRNRITLNDTYASFMRAFTIGELQTLAQRAGVQRFHTHNEPLFRILLVGEH